MISISQYLRTKILVFKTSKLHQKEGFLTDSILSIWYKNKVQHEVCNRTFKLVKVDYRKKTNNNDLWIDMGNCFSISPFSFWLDEVAQTN